MSKKDGHFLSLIVPAYKRGRGILNDLKRIKFELDQLPYPYELICVVDGNLDSTFDHANKFSSGLKNFIVLGYTKNQGKGHAVRTGMGQAQGDLIGFIDAGNDINPKNIKNLIAILINNDADIVVGSKVHPKSKVTYPWQRKILSVGYRGLISTFFNLKVKETQVGLKIYRREVIDKILPALNIKRFAFDIEMLSVASNHGFNKIYEAPVEVKLEFNRNSTIMRTSMLKEVSKMTLDTLLVFYRMRTGYYSENSLRKIQLAPEF